MHSHEHVKTFFQKDISASFVARNDTLWSEPPSMYKHKICCAYKSVGTPTRTAMQVYIKMNKEVGMLLGKKS